MLPGVDHLLERAGTVPFFENIPKKIMVNSIRNTLETLRDSILKKNRNIRDESLSDNRIIELVKVAVKDTMAFNLKHVVNATGVVVHTNLGRSRGRWLRISQLSPVAIQISSMILAPAGGAPDTVL